MQYARGDVRPDLAKDISEGVASHGVPKLAGQCSEGPALARVIGHRLSYLQNHASSISRSHLSLSPVARARPFPRPEELQSPTRAAKNFRAM